MFPKTCESYKWTRKKHSVDKIFSETNISIIFEILLKFSPISFYFIFGSKRSFKKYHVKCEKLLDQLKVHFSDILGVFCFLVNNNRNYMATRNNCIQWKTQREKDRSGLCQGLNFAIYIPICPFRAVNGESYSRSTLSVIISNHCITICQNYEIG